MVAVKVGQVWQSLRNARLVRVEQIKDFGPPSCVAAYVRNPSKATGGKWLTIKASGITGYRLWAGRDP